MYNTPKAHKVLISTVVVNALPIIFTVCIIKTLKVFNLQYKYYWV